MLEDALEFLRGTGGCVLCRLLGVGLSVFLDTFLRAFLGSVGD
jgi:hypothetical protein